MKRRWHRVRLREPEWTAAGDCELAATWPIAGSIALPDRSEGIRGLEGITDLQDPMTDLNVSIRAPGFAGIDAERHDDRIVCALGRPAQSAGGYARFHSADPVIAPLGVPVEMRVWDGQLSGGR